MRDLWAITTYFNPEGYKTREENYCRFREGIRRAGVNLLTVECAFGDRSFRLQPGSADVLQVRARDVLWQKERLINHAVSTLPHECTKVAWLDCDVLFEDPEWPVLASRLLDSYPVVQLFEKIVLLPHGSYFYSGEGDESESFCYVYRDRIHLMRWGAFREHGHTGFAWAAQRELLEQPGLYDTCLTGSGDHLMAHAFCGTWDSPCVLRMLGRGKHYQHFVNWCQTVYPKVRARLGCVPGRILHLWHGELKDRHYYEYNQSFMQFGFDPSADLQIGASGCWDLTSRSPRLQRWFREFFRSRKEDGESGAEVARHG